MGGVFFGATSFNGDPSAWDVSNVKNTRSLFLGATSFDHHLGGAWSASTAVMDHTFDHSLGTIANRTNAVDGTIVEGSYAQNLSKTRTGRLVHVF